MKRQTRTPGMFRSILCPVDFSSHSRTALKYAATLARRSNARLTALFVSDPLLVGAAAAAGYERRILENTSQEALRAFVDGAIGRARIGADAVTCAVAQGDTALEILKAAGRVSADLIAIGTQGLSGASKLFFGSTTARVLRRAAVPVLAVPPQASRRAAISSWPGRRILVALDLGPHTRADVRAAVNVARQFRTALLLVHVVKPTQAPRRLGVRVRGHDRARLERARRRLERIAGELQPGPRLACQVLVGDPAEQIPALATDAGTGLVVVTLRGTGGLFGSPQGRTTYRVLCTTGTPVLALPAHWGGFERI